MEDRGAALGRPPVLATRRRPFAVAFAFTPASDFPFAFAIDCTFAYEFPVPFML